MEPLLTIQVVGWNSAVALAGTLRALKHLPAGAADIRYIDNGSTDGSVALVRRTLAVADIIALPVNRGFAGGHNAGFACCRTPFVMVLNPDAALVWPGVQRLLEAFVDARVGAVQGKLYRQQRGEASAMLPVFDSAGIVMTRTLNGIDRGAGVADRGQYEEPAELAAVTGAAGIYRLQALREAAYGGLEVFDEKFWAYKEDVDLGWRLRLAGWRVVYLPVLTAYHTRAVGPQTAAAWSWQPQRLLARLRDRRTALSLRNWVWMLTKNMTFRTAPVYAAAAGVRLLAFAVITMVYWPLLPAWAETLRGIPAMLRRRIR